MLNIDKAGLEPLIDAVKEAIAKALGINPEDMEILSTNDTPLGGKTIDVRYIGLFGV